MRIMHVVLAILAVLLVAGCGKKEMPDCGQYMDHALRSQCLYNQSVSLRNPTMCKEVPDFDLKSKCIDDVATLLGNEAYCSYHDRLSVREGCERKVAQAVNARRKNQSAQAP